MSARAASPDRASSPSDDLQSECFLDAVNHLCSKYGNVGLSAGFLDDSGTVDLNFGCIDGGQRTPSKDSLYLISSLTKAIIALAIAVMANDPQYGISFTTPVKDVFPQLGASSLLRHSQRELTLIDLLDNRTEFPKCTNLWESPNGEIPWSSPAPILSVLRHLPAHSKFLDASSFVHARNYSNEGFALAAAVLERKTLMPWARFVRRRVLEPLGMTNTVAGLTPSEEVTLGGRIARSFSASVAGPLKDLRSAQGGSEGRHIEYDTVCQYVKNDLRAVEPIPIRPSQASRAAATLDATPIGAAGGILSSVSDLLKFYSKFIEVSNLPPTRRTGYAFTALSEVERGMMTVQEHIKAMMQDQTCAYAAGWSTSMIPWDPRQVSPKPRWPGADGDNARRVEKAGRELGHNQTTINTVWPFFQQRDARDARRPVLGHGGNMIGATSFCMVDCERRRAVVVLSNTRGYIVDCANLVGMLMASQGDPNFRDHCKAVQELACQIAASYLTDVCRYENSLTELYPILASPRLFQRCVGTYELTGGIFCTISTGRLPTAREEVGDGAEPGGECLVFRLYGSGFPYPLRLRAGSGSDEPSVTMSFAMSMVDLLPTGAGGDNRLDLGGFEVEFRRREQGQFQELVWDFSRTEGVSGRFLTFKRVLSLS